MKYFLYVILAIVILLSMIVIHELGHYVAGKIFKFKINEFSIGFGPQIFSKTNKKTGEKFSLRIIRVLARCQDFFSFYITQRVISKPRKVAAPAMLNDPTIRKGDIAIKKVNTFKTHAHLGKPVTPETIAQNSATLKTRTPEKQTYIVGIVFLKNSRMVFLASSVRPMRI